MFLGCRAGSEFYRMIEITLGNGPPCKYSISSFTMSSEILEGGTVDGSVAEPVRAEVFWLEAEPIF